MPHSVNSIYKNLLGRVGIEGLRQLGAVMSRMLRALDLGENSYALPCLPLLSALLCRVIVI